MRMLQTHVPAKLSVITLTLMRFRPPLIRYVCVFRFHPLLTAFPNRCVFDESAQRISVDGRPKRISVDGA